MEEQKGIYALSKFYDRKYEQQNSTVDPGLNREPIKFWRNHTEIFKMEIIQKSERIKENQRKLADKAAKYDSLGDQENNRFKLTHNSTKGKN